MPRYIRIVVDALGECAGEGVQQQRTETIGLARRSLERKGCSTAIKSVNYGCPGTPNFAFWYSQAQEQSSNFLLLKEREASMNIRRRAARHSSRCWHNV